MQHDDNNTKIIPRGLYSLWVGFTMAIVIFLIPIILSNVVGVFYFPLIALFLSGITYSYLKLRRQRKTGQIDCMLPLYLIARVMLTYGILMLIVNVCVLNLSHLKINLMEVDKSLHFYYYPVLLLSIITAIYSYIASKNVCLFCINCNGLSAENSIYSNLQRNEISSTMRRFTIVSLILGISGWIYYFVLYNSANISRFDRLIFSGVPVIIVLLHEIAQSVRYLSLTYNCDDLYARTPFKRNKTLDRFLLISNDSILLKKNDTDTYDTPLIMVTDFTTNTNEASVVQKFKNKFNISPHRINLLFSNIDKYYRSAINHYICFVKDQSIQIPELSRWVPSSEFQRLYNNNQLSPLLRNEAYKVFISLTAFKLFDTNGKLKYKIKEYKPTVSISDIEKCDIDYNDKRWLMYLSLHNQKKSIIARMRMFFYKYIEGIID